jgi:NAD(P)-dependent dehydrogenase (short-subunit alcohol dehydrogenase family)
MASPMELRDALVLVTGAGSGIGLATAERFAREGARLVVCDVSEAGLERVRASLGAACVYAARVDVGDREAMQAFADDVHARFGPLDVLVNNAGVGHSGAFLDTPLEDWDWVLRVNVMGVVHGCHFFGPALAARGRGAIVNVSSVLGFFPVAQVAAYAASKHAVLGLTGTMRAELGPKGIRVCAVCPGVIDTAIIDTTRFAGKRDPEKTRARTAASFKKRGYPPARVADAIVGAIHADEAVVPVSPEAWVMHYVTRLLPAAIPLFGRLSSRAATGR